MGLNIKMTGVKINGNAKVLNNLNVGENSSAKIDMDNTSVQDNASVLNDVQVNGTLDYSLKDVTIDKTASVLDGKIVNSGETFKDSMTNQNGTLQEDYTYDSTDDIKKLKEDLEALKMSFFPDIDEEFTTNMKK